MSTMPDPDLEITNSTSEGDRNSDEEYSEGETTLTRQIEGVRNYNLPEPSYPRRSSSGINRFSVSNRASVQSTVQGQPDLLRIDTSHYPVPDMSNEARRQSIMAMDRKRRLTNSTQDSGRRRHNPSGIYDRDDAATTQALDTLPSGSRSELYSQAPGSSRIPPDAEIIDLTSSPPPQIRGASRPVPAQPTSLPSQRLYVKPRWQSDSEATECPICKKTFTFLFRRHHCRKCGRVVCNDCSPHRITIPRQFIVGPPGMDGSNSSASNNGAANLTGGDDDDDSDDDQLSFFTGVQRQQLALNPAVGGGEKVRLCNPCVPDPQPEPHRIYPSAVPPPRDVIRSGSVREPTDPLRALRPRDHQRDFMQPFPGMSAPSYVSLAGQTQRQRSYRPHANTLESSLFVGSSSHHPVPPSRHNSERYFERPRPLFEGSYGGHGRYYSMDQSRPSPHPSNRPRMRPYPDGLAYPPRSFPSPVPPPRPQLNEDDICPICRHALPLRGANGDESARESHIMDCINSRDTSAGGSLSRSRGSPQLPGRGPIHMLTFVATEKDCVGEDGNTSECSICMVEYDVGDQLARLECLCKFHKECIVSWFERKQECPVHKIT